MRLGRVVSAHGIRGELKVSPHGGPASGLTGIRLASLVDQAGAERPITIVRGRVQGTCVLLTLVGIEDRNSAAALVGCELVVARSTLPALAKDEYYWHDVLGLRVRTEDGRELGRVRAIHATGTHDVLELAGGGREYLLPYLSAFIVRQDGDELIMRLPPGLLEIND